MNNRGDFLVDANLKQASNCSAMVSEKINLFLVKVYELEAQKGLDHPVIVKQLEHAATCYRLTAVGSYLLNLNSSKF